MSKKNSNVILKKTFKKEIVFNRIYQNLKKELLGFNTRKFVVAISGGPDSLALAATSKALSLETDLQFYYVLVNHNIRKNSAIEAFEVKKLLKEFQIILNILHNKKKIGKNIQSKARQIRYDLLANFCIKKRAKIILTAHNLEDQVETFFIRLSRGSGLTGLSAMKTVSFLNKNIKLVRPLLDTKKDSLVKISKKVFGRYFSDPSNVDNKYLRTKVRSLKKPLLKSGINYDQIIKSIKNLSSSKDILDKYVNKIIRELLIITKDNVKINFKKFSKLSNEIKIKILNEAIRKIKNNYYDPRSKKVINLIHNLSKKDFKKATLAGCLFFIKKDQICVKKEQI